MGWAVSHVNRPGQPAAAEPAVSCLFGLLDNFESRSWKGWWLNSLFFLTSMHCCLKPQCCAGLKPQACCATHSRPVPLSSPNVSLETPQPSCPPAQGHALPLHTVRGGNRAVGMLLQRGLSPTAPTWHRVRGCSHLLGSGQPANNTAQVAPASPCSQPRLGKEQGSLSTTAQHSPYQLNTYPLGTGAGNRTG